MGIFKVVNKNGLREIEQVAAVDEPVATVEEDPIDEIDRILAEEDADEDADIRAMAGDPLIEAEEEGDQLDAYNRLAGGLHENGVDWAKRWISELTHADQVLRIEELERNHPKYENGRNGVLAALEERRGELGSGDPVPAPPVAAQGGGIPCDHCDFTAGSQAGMDAHMETHHADAS